MSGFDLNIVVAYGLILVGVVGCLSAVVWLALAWIKPTTRPDNTEFIE